MELAAIGFDDWFEQRSAAILQPGQSMARVTAVDRGAFLLRNQDAEIPAELAGKFRFVAIGDRRIIAVRVKKVPFRRVIQPLVMRSGAGMPVGG